MFYISETRIDGTTKEVINLLESSFGVKIWENFVFLVKCPNSEEDLEDLDVKSKSDYVNQRAAIIEKEFNLKQGTLKCYGIDIFKDFKEKVNRKW